jgi:hypothetical protein
MWLKLEFSGERNESAATTGQAAAEYPLSVRLSSAGLAINMNGESGLRATVPHALDSFPEGF